MEILSVNGFILYYFVLSFFQSWLVFVLGENLCIAEKL